MLGKIEGRRIRGWQKMRWLDGITESLDMNLGELREIVRVREAWHAAVHGVVKSWTQLSDCTATHVTPFFSCMFVCYVVSVVFNCLRPCGL